MKELNETNWIFIKCEDINIYLDLFITHFCKMYDKIYLTKHNSNNILFKKRYSLVYKKFKDSM